MIGLDPTYQGEGMAPRVDRDGAAHSAVVSNLLDLQARLRGDPASLVLPREGRPRGQVSVAADDVSVTSSPAPDPERRIEALRRRLESIELQIDAYERLAEDATRASSEPPPAADVTELQHAIEERLTEG
jgi:L-alanine-DL-glutamate epimerase-like enolase superfamily enzyme